MDDLTRRTKLAAPFACVACGAPYTGPAVYTATCAACGGHEFKPATLQWRSWAPGSPGDSLMTVVTYETPIGKTCEPKHSRAARIQHVSREDAVRMLRTGATV